MSCLFCTVEASNFLELGRHCLLKPHMFYLMGDDWWGEVFLFSCDVINDSPKFFSLCGSDDYKVFDTCELHGEVRYPTGNECPEIYRALDGVRYIAECTKREEESCKVNNYLSNIMVLMPFRLGSRYQYVVYFNQRTGASHAVC